MIRYKPGFLVLFILLFEPVHWCFSQVGGFRNLYTVKQSTLQINAFNEYSKIKFSDKGNFASKISLDYFGSFGSCGLSANINYGPKFEILPEDLTIIIPEYAIINQKDKIQPRPNYYELENPFSAYTNYYLDQFKLSLAANFFTRSEIKETYWLKNVITNYYDINFERIEKRKFDILLSGAVSYSIDGIDMFLGLVNIPLLSKGDLDHPNFSIYPIAGLKYSIFEGYSTAYTNIRELLLSYTNPFRISWIDGENPITISASIKRNFDKYSYQAVGINVEFPLLSNFLLSFGIKRSWGKTDQLDKKGFEEWRNSIDNILDDDLAGGLDHINFGIGVSVLLNSTKEEFLIRLVNSKIIQKHIYSAKRELYAYNPIGTIDLHNSGKTSVRCQVSLQLPDQLGSYRSESMDIGGDEIKTVPIYLYLSESELKEHYQNIQMNIFLETTRKKQIISTIPITLFDKHSWDGNTWGLKYFITVDEPAILANAKKKYIQSFISDSSLNEYQQKFAILKNFITELGRGIHYVQDPTSTMFVDRVQYPIETIYEQTGDCDDLSVYLAAHLMSVGFRCVLVDVKPQPKEIELPTAGQSQIGHIFLLVDTGLDVENIGEIGLKEFQFVSRKSVSGKITAWIPIETTYIDQGFEKAFREGTAQYYREVIERNGILNGTVHVYDL